MIELRYLRTYKFHPVDDWVEVLQYRQKIVSGAWATTPPPNSPICWTEWIDVPVVIDSAVERKHNHDF